MFNYYKGQCHEIFCFLFFSWISFTPTPEYHIRTVLIFFENSRRYSQAKVHHRYQRHRRHICHRYQRHRWQILPSFSLVLLIPVANLPPVSTIPAASVSPQPQSITLAPFWFFSKIPGDIRKPRCTTGINDAGGKFTTGVSDTGGK